jgi:hypothetical protein
MTTLSAVGMEVTLSLGEPDLCRDYGWGRCDRD